MMPADVPAAVRSDPKRRAEVEVFERLRDDSRLKGFTIYYSCWWLAEHRGMLRDGEADFIAAHPDIGFIAIEVKGGVVSRRASDNSWWSRGKGGAIYSIQDPVAQARKSKKVLLESLLREWQGQAPFIWARHGVMLPHSSKPTASPHLGAAMPLDIFAFEDDMPHLGARLMQMLLWRPEGSREKLAFGSQGISILDRLSGEDFELCRNLASEISWTERKIIELTDQQKRLMNLLSLQRRALILGGAGTGKSVLALEKVRRLAGDGRKVLLLCFNKPLSVKLTNDAGSGAEITVETFHACCTRIADGAGLHPRRQKAKQSKEEFFGTVLPSLLAKAVQADPAERYDAVVIDEGQDFKPDQLATLERLVAEDGLFVVFADANQGIYNKCDLGVELGMQPLLLCDNIRNTRQIFDAMSHFYRGPEQEGRGPDGPEVRWVVAELDRVAALLRAQINELTLIDGIAPEDIAVLTGCAVADSNLADVKQLGEHPVTNASQQRAGHIIVDSVHRFKGLDSAVVILTHMDGASAEPELPYVALSRAKSLMIVIGQSTTIAFLQAEAR